MGNPYSESYKEFFQKIYRIQRHHSKVLETLKNERIPVIVGSDMEGRSLLLQWLEKILLQKKYIVALHDASETTWSCAEDIERAIEISQGTTPGRVLCIEGSEEPIIITGKNGKKLPFFHGVADIVNAHPDKTFVLCLDDIESLHDDEIRQIFIFYNAMPQNLFLVMTCSRYAKEYLAAFKKDKLTFELIPLSPLSLEDIELMVAVSFDALDTEAIAEAVYAYTKGHPFQTRMVLNALWWIKDKMTKRNWRRHFRFAVHFNIKTHDETFRFFVRIRRRLVEIEENQGFPGRKRSWFRLFKLPLSPRGIQFLQEAGVINEQEQFTTPMYKAAFGRYKMLSLFEDPFVV